MKPDKKKIWVKTLFLRAKFPDLLPSSGIGKRFYDFIWRGKGFQVCVVNDSAGRKCVKCKYVFSRDKDLVIYSHSRTRSVIPFQKMPRLCVNCFPNIEEIE